MALWPVVPVDLIALGTLTVADGKSKWKAPFAGKIIAVDGWIKTLGSGATTSTDFQISCGTKDYLATVGAFEVDSATSLLESQVLVPNTSFAAGDIIELDCDAVSTSPADAFIRLWVAIAPV